MKKNLIISSVAAFAALNPEGFTVNAANLRPVTTGFAVALKRTQNNFGAEGLAKVANVIEELQASGNLNGRTLAFGGWYDSIGKYGYNEFYFGYYSTSFCFRRFILRLQPAF